MRRLLLIALLFTGCGEPPPDPHADSGTSGDGGEPFTDGGNIDAGAADGGLEDAGAGDADAGTSDGGQLDAGGGDAGTGADDGGSDGGSDAGFADGGLPKAPCRGLMVRDGYPTADTRAFIRDLVVNVDWAEIERDDGGFGGPGWAQIDAALDGGYRVRLRVLAGVAAPPSVKRLGHAPMSGSRPDGGPIDCTAGGIALYNAVDQKGFCSTFFWTPPVMDRYERMMGEVARRYEAHEQLAEVVDSECMTLYAEPFYRAHKDPGSNARLLDAGLSFQGDLACHQRAIAFFERAFPRTRTSLAVNPWDIVHPDGGADHVLQAWDATRDFVQAARAQMGGRLVLQNNGLGEDEGCSASAPHYCFLGDAGAPKGFQTETLAKLGGGRGVLRAIDAGIAMGANFIELPAGYRDAVLDAGYSLADLAAEDARLEAQPCCDP